MENRKIQKMLVCCILLGVLCGLVSGCSETPEVIPEMTVEQLMTEMSKISKEHLITYEEVDVSMDVAYETKMEGYSLSVGALLGMELEQWISPEPFSSYSKGTMTVEVMNQDYDFTVEDYRLEEDGKIISYTYDGMTDEWLKEESSIEPSAYYSEFYSKVAYLEPIFEEAVLLEEKVTLNDKEAYVLLAECNGEDIKEALDNIGFFKHFDFTVSVETLKEMKMPVTCYVDAESFLPLQIELEQSGMEEFVKMLLVSETEIPENTEEEEYDIRVNECHLTVKNISYEKQEIPQIPENVKNSFSILDVLEFAGGHLGDGSYLLISGSKVAGMDNSSLEGYKVIEYITEQSVTLQSDDESKVIYFEAMSEAAAHQYFEDTEDTLKMLMEALDVEGQAIWENETVSTHLGDVDVYGVTDQEGMVLYNTVVSTDHMSVCITAIDMAGEWDDPEVVIEPLVDTLSEVTVETLPFMGYNSYQDFDGAEMLERIAKAVEGKQITYAEARFSDYGIYLMREKGIGIQATAQNNLSAEVFAGEFLQWNDRVYDGLFNGEDMYSLTVLYSGKELLDIFEFCSPVFMDVDMTEVSRALDDAEIITYFIIDPDTNLPVQIMFDISEINGLLYTDKTYFVLDKITY